MYARKNNNNPPIMLQEGLLKTILVRAQKKGRDTKRASILRNAKVFNEWNAGKI